MPPTSSCPSTLAPTHRRAGPSLPVARWRTGLRRLQATAIWFLLLLFPTFLLADDPRRLESIDPPTLQRGASTSIRLVGSQMNEATALMVAGRLVPLRAVDDGGGHAIELDASPPEGPCDVVAIGPWGASTPRRVLVLPTATSPLPSADAVAAIGEGQWVSGHLQRGVVHRFSVELKADESVTFDGWSTQIDSHAVAQLQLFDVAGRVVAQSHPTLPEDDSSDVQLSYRATVAGTHVLHLHDVSFEGGDAYGIVLHRGFADNAIRQWPRTIAASGAAVEAVLDDEVPSTHRHREVESNDDAARGMAIDGPTIVDATWQVDDAADWYRVTLPTPGRWTIELVAARRGHPLDGLVNIYSASPSADDPSSWIPSGDITSSDDTLQMEPRPPAYVRSSLDPIAFVDATATQTVFVAVTNRFPVPAEAVSGVRYELRVRRFEAKLVQQRRRAYAIVDAGNDPTQSQSQPTGLGLRPGQTRLIQLQRDVSADPYEPAWRLPIDGQGIEQAGGQFAAGQSIAWITITRPIDATFAPMVLVRGPMTPIDGTDRIVIPLLCTRPTPEGSRRLPSVRVTDGLVAAPIEQPPATTIQLQATPSGPRSWHVLLRANRSQEAPQPIDAKWIGLPSGWQAPSLVIAADASAAEGELLADPSIPAGPLDLIMAAAMGEQTIISPAITVELKPSS
jgi:hypothetical protein